MEIFTLVIVLGIVFWIRDMHFIWRDADDWSIASMKLLDLQVESAVVE